MTNEQAKNIIVSCDGIMWNRLTDEENEALSMAIEALQQECEKCIFSPFKQFQPERKKGEWIDDGFQEEWWGEQFTCSICDGTMIGISKYCPECGAKMREVTK